MKSTAHFEQPNYVGFTQPSQTQPPKGQTTKSAYFGWRKRSFDVATTIVFAPAILFAVACVAIGIKATTKGPVFFRQTRNGKDMKPFTIIKFQTYKSNLETPVFGTNSTKENLTSIGRFLRKTSLDELPNFYNVLRGEMSLVGSRPHVLKQDAEIAKTLPNWNRRYAELPGITGLSQVSGEAGPMITAEHCTTRLDLDVEYIKTASLFMDFKILVGTVFKGFYRSRS